MSVYDDGTDIGPGGTYEKAENYYDDETFNETLPDDEAADEVEQHAKTCITHDEHWQDDFAYTNDDRLPVPEDAPRLSEVAKLIMHATKEGDNPVIYRFSLVYVDAATGNLQVITNPGMSGPASVNLLARAASVIAFQEAQLEKQAQQLLAGGLKTALRGAVEHGEGLPNLAAIFGHSGLIRPPTAVEDEDEQDLQTGQYL